MAGRTYRVKLAETDPFRATFRTFDGIPGRFTVEPTVVELTGEQVKALGVWGLVIEPASAAASDPAPDGVARKGEGR